MYNQAGGGIFFSHLISMHSIIEHLEVKILDKKMLDLIKKVFSLANSEDSKYITELH